MEIGVLFQLDKAEGFRGIDPGVEWSDSPGLKWAAANASETVWLPSKWTPHPAFLARVPEASLRLLPFVPETASLLPNHVS